MKNAKINPLFDLMNDYAFILNDKGFIVDVNKSALKKLKYELDQIIGMEITSLFIDSNKNVLNAKLSQIHICKNLKCVLSLIDSEGNIVPVNSVITYDEENKSIYIISQDIINKVNLNLLSMMDFKKNRTGILIKELKSNVVIDVNEVFCSIMEYEKNEILSKSFFDLNLVKSKEFKEILDLLLAKNNELYSCKVNFNTKTGMEKTCKIDFQVVKIDNEKYILIRVVDKTEIEKAKKKATETENLFTMLFNKINSSIIVYDVINDGATSNDYIIKDMNRKCMEIEGVDISDFRGKKLSTMRSNVDEFGIIKLFQKVWKTGIPQYLPPKQYFEKGRKPIWYENNIIKLPTNEIVAIYDDVTETMEKTIAMERMLIHEKVLNDINKETTLNKSDFIEHTLNVVGKAFNKDRIFIYKFNTDDDLYELTHEWKNVGVPSIKKEFKCIPAKMLLNYNNDFKNVNSLIYNKIENSRDLEFIHIIDNIEINSFIAHPLNINGGFYGYIGINSTTEERIYTQEDLDLLLAVSRILSQSLSKYNAEAKLINSEKKYRDLFQNMTSSFTNNEVIFNENGEAIDYKFIEVNRKFEQNLGLSSDQIVGKKVSELLPNNDNYWLDKFSHVVITGEPLEFEEYSTPLKKYFHIVAFKTGDKTLAVISNDITERKKMEKAIYTEKEQLQITLKSIGDGVIATDNNAKVTMLNEVAEQLTGWCQEDARGKYISDIFNIINEHTGETVNNPINEALSTGKIVELANHTILRSKNNTTEYNISDSAAPIKNNVGNIHGAVLVFRDVTQERKRNSEILYLSMHDSLTGLYNRLFFEEKLKYFHKNNQYPISVIMGDVNGLKIANDVFGHSKGDKLLITISEIMLSCVSPDDFVARWGGDEFVVLLPKSTAKRAQKICEEIYKKCETAEAYKLGNGANPSISLGYSTREKPVGDILHIVKSAEDLMYKRKLLESRSTHSTIIASMKNTLFEKSHETEQHANRLSKYCCSIGKEMGLPEHDIYDLELFSILHDIGKVAIDGNILTKKGKLTDEEWEEIKRHPEIGYRIANSAPELTKIAEYILTHHERYDGKGYPQGLKGNNIPLISRILAVVDSFDAMTQDRPYRKALPINLAIEELIKNAGTQFDPKIVTLFVEKVLPKQL